MTVIYQKCAEAHPICVQSIASALMDSHARTTKVTATWGNAQPYKANALLFGGQVSGSSHQRGKYSHTFTSYSHQMNVGLPQLMLGSTGREQSSMYLYE